jgi:predicted TIM-barrel fold metal-dependent hydrolase
MSDDRTMHQRVSVPGPPTVDAHVHAWSNDVRRFPWAPVNGASPPGVRGDAEWLLGVLAAHGISRAVVVQSRIYGEDHGYLGSVLRAHGDRVIGVGYVDAARPDVAARVSALTKTGVRGVRLDPLGDGGSWLLDQRADAVWRAADAAGLVIELLIATRQLAAVDRWLAAWPRVPVVIEHMALYEAPDRSVDALLALARHPRVAVKISALRSISAEQAPYADLRPLVGAVVAAFGSGRCMWGSDMPWMGEAAYASEVAAGGALVDDESDRAALMGGTATQVFTTWASDGRH